MSSQKKNLMEARTPTRRDGCKRHPVGKNGRMYRLFDRTGDKCKTKGHPFPCNRSWKFAETDVADLMDKYTRLPEEPLTERHGAQSSAKKKRGTQSNVAVDVQPLAGAPAEGEPAGEEDEPPPALAASPAAGAQPQAT